MGRSLLMLALLLLSVGVARADNISVGVFTPSATFPSTTARVELASRLGDHLGKSLGRVGTGRVYARAGDFASAVKKGDVQVALVDATYLSTAGGGYTVIGVATRNGEIAHPWQLISKVGKTISDLKGKRVTVPTIGGRETEFVLNVMLAGEVPRDFFAKIEIAPDTAAALAAVGLGRADVAVVPTGVELPAGTSSVLTLPPISGPVLVAYGTVSQAQRTALIAAATSFKGDSTIGGFRGSDGEGIRAIARRYGVPPKRGQLAVPAVRLVVGDLVEGRTFSIERTPAASFVLAPK